MDDILGPAGQRRGAERQTALATGELQSSDGTLLAPCVVRNISASGALLQVEAPQDIASPAILVIDGQDGRKPFVIAWRSETHVAVRFIGETQDDPAHSGWVFPAAGDREAV